MKITSLFFVLLLSFSLSAQSPIQSAKLEKEKGFNLLKVGALYSEIKSVLQKDTLNRKDSFEPKCQIVSYTDRIYLVNLKKPGYSQFNGKNIDRIEVWFQAHYDDKGEAKDYEITEVKIFFKKISEADTDAFFNRLIDIYGMPASGGVDFPEEGVDTYTWFSEMVLMNGTSFYGDPATEKMKKEYLKVSFESAVGG